MKKVIRILTVLLSTFITVSCSGNGDEEVENKSKEIVVTGSAEVLSSTSATLNGYANDVNGEIGFCYSDSEKNPTLDNAKTITASMLMSDYSYSVTLMGLSPATTYYYRAYGTKDGLKVMAKDVRNFTTEAVLVTSITVKGSSTNLRVGQTLQLSTVVKPNDATDKSVTWTSSNTSIATVTVNGVVTAVSVGQVEIIAQANDGSRVVGKFILTVKQTGGGTYEYVDLGLPSGLKWATMNIGATSPNDFGDYFAWGETEPKDYYDNTTYLWYAGSGDTYTKYSTSPSYGIVDYKTILDPEDDAAHVNWGGTWRMPKENEFYELCHNCTWTWTTQNGVNGYKVTGSNGKSIFLPAAGFRTKNILSCPDSYGRYWSSTLKSSISELAFDLEFKPAKSNSIVSDRSFSDRYVGYSIRPVCP